MIKRTIICDACGVLETESIAGSGWAGWGGINGVRWRDMDNPNLCPACLAKVMNIVDKELGNGMD